MLFSQKVASNILRVVWTESLSPSHHFSVVPLTFYQALQTKLIEARYRWGWSAGCLAMLGGKQLPPVLQYFRTGEIWHAFRGVTPTLGPNISEKYRDTRPISIAVLCESMPSSWSEVVLHHPFVWHTPPICTTKLLQKYWSQGLLGHSQVLVRTFMTFHADIHQAEAVLRSFDQSFAPSGSPFLLRAILRCGGSLFQSWLLTSPPLLQAVLHCFKQSVAPLASLLLPQAILCSFRQS